MSLKEIWNKISFLGLEKEQEFSHREVVLLNKLVLVACLVILPVIPLEVFLNGWELVPYELLILLISGITLFFSYKGWHTFAKIYFFFIAVGYIWFMGIMVGYGSGNELALVAVFVAPSMLFNDFRMVIILSIIALAAMVGLKFVQDVIPPYFDIAAEDKANFRIVFQVVTLVILFFEIHYFKNINFRYQKLVESKNEVIAEKNKEIVDSINYAKRIQQSYLPTPDLLQRFFPQSFMFFQPKDIVSGDFYWFYTPHDNDHIEDETFIIAADCTGHGVPGAIMSIICTNALNEVIVKEKERDTALILDKVRTKVVNILKSEHGESRKDGMDVSLCKINRKTNEIQFSGANNPLWILRKNSTVFEVIKGDKQPVGLYENESNFTSHLLSCSAGDRIYLFSDGLQDQFGGAKGKKFKAANMKKLFISLQNKPIQSQGEQVKSSFEDWKGDLEQVDDIVLIGIEF